MKKLIADKDVVIIGGHINWQNKLKELFPGWKYIAPDAYKTVDGSMLEKIVIKKAEPDGVEIP